MKRPFFASIIILSSFLFLLAFRQIDNPQFTPSHEVFIRESINLHNLFNKLASGIVKCYSGGTYTTGFFIDDNWIVTAGHKVNRDFPEASEVYIKIPDENGNKKAIEIVIPDEIDSDLIFIKTDYKAKYKFTRFKKPVFFEENWIFGFRGDGGIVPSNAGYVTIFAETGFLLTTARTYYGNSGSPIINRKGEVLGMLVRATPSWDGLFIPGDIIKDAYQKYIKKDK